MRLTDLEVLRIFQLAYKYYYLQKHDRSLL